METKRYIISDENGNHEYDLTIENNDDVKVLTLSFSYSKEWVEHIRGTVAMQMFDDGNGVRFSKKLKHLDYSELLHVRLLINLEYKTDSNVCNQADYTALEVADVINL